MGRYKKNKLVLFLLAVVALAYLGFTSVNINNAGKSEAKSIQEYKQFEFSTFTSAVCEERGDFVHCKDEVFVNCNGNVSKASDFIECEGIGMHALKATGFVVFEKGWKDPRI